MTVITITKESGIPLVGHLAFGLIFRGASNLVQVRATTICNLTCPFCSTDGGPNSTSHKTHYVVDPGYLLEWTALMTADRGPTHINLDSVGEPTAYPHLTYLISKLSEMPQVEFVSMQTNGTLLNKEKVKELEKAGLKRINLSIHALNIELAKKLAGSSAYNINSITDLAKDIRNTTIDLLIAPVYLPGVNDKDIQDIIALGKRIGCKVAIQKYEEYKYSRKMKSIKKQNFYRFYQQLKAWEKEFNMKLVYKAEDLNVRRAPAIKPIMRIGERCNVKVLEKGWMENQMLAAHKNRCITIAKCAAQKGDKVNIKITDNKNNIYLAEKLK